MIHIDLPCHHRPSLTRCAVDALRRTMTQPYRVWSLANDDPALGGEVFSSVQRGSYAEGRKRDAVLRALPREAKWLFCMHTDSAPLLSGWFEWLQDRMGNGACAGFLSTCTSGLPHPSGALYRVAWLRDIKASFVPVQGFDVGASLMVPPPGDVFVAQQATTRPWWLRDSDVAMNEMGRLIYAHMGGGTIGATSRRLPWWAWPYVVRRELTRNGC